MIRWFGKQRVPAALLGLSFDGGQLEGVVVRRSNGSLQPQKSFSAPLALNPLSAAPELAGREIRNHLTHAGIRERQCAICIPASWALILQIKVPELAEADVASFLAVEAERGFPYAVETLLVARSFCQGPSGERYATLAAIPRNHLAQLEKALRAARLRPVSFTLATAALQRPAADPSEGVVALAIRDNHVDLQVTWGGGILALRSLDPTGETERGEKILSAEKIAPAIRITLGQLPPEIRSGVKKARIFGQGQRARDLAQQLAPNLESMNVRCERVEYYGPAEFGKKMPPETPVSAALSLAGQEVAGIEPPFEFLPPKTNSWQRFSGNVSSRKLVWAGATAASVALVISAGFLAQQWQFSALQSQWGAMEPRVKELEELQQQIKKFRPWFDERYPGLAILKTLTEAFPAEGSVSAKTVEVREGSTVSCSGVARDSQALLSVYDKLRSAKEIANLKLDQMRGKTPLQFTFNFQWSEGGAGEN